MTDLFRDGVGNPRVKGSPATEREHDPVETVKIIIPAGDQGANTRIVLATPGAGKQYRIWGVVALTDSVTGGVSGNDPHDNMLGLVKDGDGNTIFAVGAHKQGPMNFASHIPMGIVTNKSVTYTGITTATDIHAPRIGYLTLYYNTIDV